MKRVISFILALAMLLSTGAAFAAGSSTEVSDQGKEAAVEVINHGVEKIIILIRIPLTGDPESDKKVKAYDQWEREYHNNFEHFAKYSIKITVPEGVSETWYNEAIKNDVKVDYTNISKEDISYETILQYNGQEAISSTEYFSFPSWDTVKDGGTWYLVNTAIGSPTITATTSDSYWVSEYDEKTCVWREEIYKFDAKVTAAIKSESICDFTAGDIYSVSGRVVDKEGNPIPDVEMTVMQGNNINGTTTTGDQYQVPKGTYLFENLPAGIYNVVAGKDGITRTVLVEITDSDVEIPDIVLPEEKTNSFVEVEDETDGAGGTGSGSSGEEDGERFEVVVGGVDDLFNDNDQIFSDADDDIVKDEGSVDLKIKVKKKNIQDKDNDDQQLDEEKDKTHHIGLYLEMGVSKEVKNKDGSKNEDLSKDEIPDVGKLLQIVVKLPKGLREKSEYVVYRVHNGKTESMNPLEGDPMTYDGTEEGFFYIKDKDIVIIYSRMFSTYGIGYEEAEQPSNNNTGSSGYSGPNLWYIGGNTFDTSTTQNPTKVEIDGKNVPFTMNGSKIVVGCVEPGAKWLTVHWGSSTNTVRFTPDANAYCTQTVIPKTGDMPLWAYIAVFFGF